MSTCRTLLFALMSGLVAACCWATDSAEPAEKAPVVEAEAPEILWLEDMSSAKAAARETGKPVYAFMYYIPAPGERPEDDKRSLSCRRMRFETFGDPEVRRLLSGFVCCALDETAPDNREMADKYALGVSKDPASKTRFGALPANLFTDAHGDEHYIQWGYIPSAGFRWVLENVLVLENARTVLAEKPDDARSNADLGAAMMELDLLKTCREPLEKAVAADPDNKVGAREDASLNLILLDVPDDLAAGFTRLSKYIEGLPETREAQVSDNALKARYYQAVTLYAQEGADKYKAALELLSWFKRLTPDSPQYRNRWATEAAKLDVLVRDTLAAANEK